MVNVYVHDIDVHDRHSSPSLRHVGARGGGAIPCYEAVSTARFSAATSASASATSAARTGGVELTPYHPDRRAGSIVTTSEVDGVLGEDRALVDQQLLTLRDLVSSTWIPHAIHAAASLGLPDLLADGPRRAEDLAADGADADPVALERLMRALVTLDILAHSDDGGFALAPLGQLLRSDQHDSLRERVLLTAGSRSNRSWNEFFDCVRLGQTAGKILDDIDDPFSWFRERPEEQARFDAAMSEGASIMAGPIAEAYDFSGIGSIVDVGGGYGAVLVPVLSANPSMTGIDVDQPHCAEGARRLIVEAGLNDRYTFVAGDLFSDDVLPSGADAYLLKSVLHDWDDQRSLTLLRLVRTAIPDTGRLLVVEKVVPDLLDRSMESRRMVWADLNMMVATGGRERTESQYRALLADGGFRLERVLPTTAGIDIIEARPA